MSKNSSPILSIVILNFNSGSYLASCLKSVYDSKLGDYRVELIVSDNASTDQSISLSREVINKNPNLTVNYLILDSNIGFAAGNNRGIQVSNPDSKYLLFLNPDTIVENDTLAKMIDFFEKTPDADAATCYINLALTGQMQPECHRGFPTPWRSLSYFTGLYKLSSKSALLNGYFLGNLDVSKTHKIEACVGAFLMVKRTVGQKINWWNEKYFFYGEDLDFCYQLHKRGYCLYFYPDCRITHFQGVSSGLINKTKKISRASRQTKIKVAQASTQAMRIFYQENLLQDYSFLTRSFVMAGINLLQSYRILKAKYL